MSDEQYVKMTCTQCEREIPSKCPHCNTSPFTIDMTDDDWERLHQRCGEDMLGMLVAIGHGGMDTRGIEAITDREEQAYTMGVEDGRKNPAPKEAFDEVLDIKTEVNRNADAALEHIRELQRIRASDPEVEPWSGLERLGMASLVIWFLAAFWGVCWYFRGYISAT